MSEQRIEMLRLLVRVLFAAAAAALVLSIVAAVEIGSSSSSIPGLDDATLNQSRGVGTLAVLGAGVIGAGILAALAAILAVLLDREERER